MSPEVSVVIPTFNRADTVLRAINSVLDQTHEDLEVIVVDDGSSDHTPRVLAMIANQRVRMLRHRRNRGAAAARNTGIQAAKGAFVAFLDSDDAWLPNKLTTQLGALRSAPVSTAVSCHGVIMHLLDHRIEREQPLESSEDWRLRLALGCALNPGTTQLARREIFNDVGLLDESLPRFEDWDWLLRYAEQGGAILSLPQPLAHVWNRRGRLGAQHELSARRFAAKHAELYASLPSHVRRQALCDIWLQVSGTYAFEGLHARAALAACRGASYRPLHCAFRVTRHLLSRIAIAAGRTTRMADA